MPLEVTSEAFAAEYKKCFEDSKQDTSTLYRMVKPFIEYWARNLNDLSPDIHMVSLLRLLSPDIDIAIKKTEEWLSIVEDTHTLEEELTEVFFETLRGIKYWPKQASPVMVEYVVALAFKRKLKDLIKFTKPQIFDPDLCLTYSPNYPDYYLLRRLQVEAWDRHLTDWVMRRYNVPTISRVTHISEDTIRHDLRKLCQLAFSIDRQHSAKLATQMVSTSALSSTN